MGGFLMVIDIDGVVLYASDNMRSYLTLTPHDVIGHSINDFIKSETDREIIRKNLMPEGIYETKLAQSMMVALGTHFHSQSQWWFVLSLYSHCSPTTHWALE